MRIGIVVCWVVIGGSLFAPPERTPEEWVERLGAPTQAEREEAEAVLRALGDAALPVLESAPRDVPEVASRVGALIDEIRARAAWSPAWEEAVPFDRFLEAAYPRLLRWEGMTEAEKVDLLSGLSSGTVEASADWLPLVARAWRDDEPTAVRTGALAALFQVVRYGVPTAPARAARALTEGLEDSDPEVRRVSLLILGFAGRSTVQLPFDVETLRGFAGHDEPQIRVVGIRQAAARRIEGAFDLLNAALDDDSEEVRVAAIDGLALLERREVIPLLRERLAGSEGTRERVACMRALGRFQDPEAVPLILRWIEEEPVQTTRTACMHALADITTPAAIEGILRFLEDPDPQLRAAAAEHLARLGRIEGIPWILQALDREPDPIARARIERALDALRKLPPPERDGE